MHPHYWLLYSLSESRHLSCRVSSHKFLKHLTSVKIIIVCETFCVNFGCIRVKQKIKCDQIITVSGGASTHPPPPSIPPVDCDVISPTQSPESSRASSSGVARWRRCGFCIKLFLTKNHFPRNVNCRKRRAAVHSVRRHPGALAVTRPPWSLPSCTSQIVTTAWMQEFLHKESFSSYLQNTETKV